MKLIRKHTRRTPYLGKKVIGMNLYLEESWSQFLFFKWNKVRNLIKEKRALTQEEKYYLVHKNLKKAGNIGCRVCGRFPGVRYKFKDGKSRGISLRKSNYVGYVCNLCKDTK